MLLSRIEQKPRTRLDCAPHAQPPQFFLQTAKIRGPISGKRIQRPMIERDRDAAITDLSQYFDRLERIVVRKPVGVISQQHRTLVSTTLRLRTHHSHLSRIYPPPQ